MPARSDLCLKGAGLPEPWCFQKYGDITVDDVSIELSKQTHRTHARVLERCYAKCARVVLSV